VLLAVANLVLAAYMTGVIWVVQAVHYPLFAAVGRPGWPDYEAAHRRRITPVVGPAMLAQAAVAVALVLGRPGLPAAVNLALALGLLASTVTVFGALHERLAGGWDGAAHRRLLRLNAVRAVAWTAQVAVAIALIP
jgi:hypothetical protein